ncbi:uncharacterized protein LOC113650151 [Tachysurus fulvidraco]|uniref:uncharacterized protein LOC113650151 n=1 Tax=Tachysurus fulvidraco TaxID=1234273 RepID=UPI001FED9027|nr:uncharacterized protein LOC113650151 [Tachysurus fulvidraco]XP_047662093.1 uncharacterized protein LOC113650151 [Tachysurus fulvidraco]
MAQSKESTEKSLKSTFKVVKKYKDEFSLNNVMEGDVFVVKHERNVENAGVYTDEQIIQLKKVSTGMFYNSTEINKVNVDAFTGGKSFAVYRKKKGIPQSFKKNIEAATSKCPETNFHEYNCMEFVMELLGVFLQPNKSECRKIVSGTKPKGFKVVKNYADDYKITAMLGDLFLVRGGPFGSSNLHAGVCYSEKGPKIIQLLETTTVPGVVNKVHLNGFSAGMRYAIYRSKKGIPDSFKKKVDEALSRKPNHQEERYSNMRFALELLFGELEEKERDVEELNEILFGDTE